MQKVYQLMNVSGIMDSIIGGLMITCGIVALVNGIIVNREKHKILF